MSRVRILVLPIIERKWFFYALPAEAGSQQLAQDAARSMQAAGSSLEDRIARLGSRIGNSVHSLLLRQWRSLESAKPGSLKARIYRAAQVVLSKEDAQQTAFKDVPSAPSGVEVIYPSGLKEALVRRRLRMLLKSSAAQYQRTTIVWGVISVPLVPVLVLPVPAFPLYYTLWKAYSAQQALAGVHALQRSWNVWDAIVLADLRRQLQSMQRNGVVFPSGGWPSRILSLAPRYLGILESPEAKVLRFYKQLEPTDVVPQMRPSQQLDALIQPGSRGQTQPLGSETMTQIARLYDAPALPELVERALKQARAGTSPRKATPP